MSKKIYRAVIYCRVSQEDAGNKLESNSITTQKLFCEEYVRKQEDIELVHEPIVDDGVSGVTHDRVGFRKLEDGIADGQFDCIIVKDLSRFSRNYIDAGRYIERIFPNLGIRFIAVADHYDSLSSDAMADSYSIPFKNLINDSYCKDISIKIRSSLESKRKNGEFVGSFCAYGYAKDENNRNQLIVDEAVRGTIEMIFSLYKDGVGIGHIAKQLNESGVLSPLEYKKSIGLNYKTVFKTSEFAKWEYNTVKRILTNEVYLGTLVQGKQSKINYKVKKKINHDKSQWTRVEHTHEAIISKADFDAVQKMMQRDMRYVSDSKNGKNVLAGFVFCPDCGATMIRKVVNYKTKKYVYYTCGSYLSEKTCSAHSIKAENLEKYILEALRYQFQLFGNFRTEEAYTRATKKQVNFEVEIAKYIHEIEELKKIKLRIYQDFTEGILTKDEYFDYIQEYTQQIAYKEATLSQLEDNQNKAVDSVAKVSNEDFQSIISRYQNLEVLDRRVLLSLVDKILIYGKDRVEVCFQFADIVI